jgi:hypothetical protein
MSGELLSAHSWPNEEIVTLYNRIMSWEGDVEQNETWLLRLEAIHPDFWVDSHMRQARLSVARRRSYERLVANMGEHLTREHMVNLVGQLAHGEGSEAEQDAIVLLLERNFSNPSSIDLIFWPPDDLKGLSPEEIVDRALATSPHLPEASQHPGT